MLRNKKTTIRSAGKALWYGAATILVLSLPTYSYLRPDLSFELAKTGAVTAPAAGLESRAPGQSEAASSVSVVTVSKPSFVRGFHSSDSVPPSVDGLLAVAVEGVGSAQDAAVLDERQMVRQSARTAVEIDRNSRPHPDRRRESVSYEPGPADLVEMEQALEMAAVYLFSREPAGPDPVRTGNPFRNALNSRGLGGGAGRNSASQKGDPGGDGGEPAGETPASVENPPDDGPLPEDPVGPDPADERQYLIIGKFSAGEESLVVSRARQRSGGTFELENGTFLNPWSGFVGGVSQPLIARTGESIVTGISTGETSPGVLYFGLSGFMGFIQGYAGALNGSSPLFELVYPFEVIESAASFDYDGDGRQDLVIIFSGKRSLFLYRASDSGLTFAKELLLPFDPAVIVSTVSRGPVSNSYLNVLDDSLQRSITFNSRYPGIYSIGMPSSYRYASSVLMDSPQDLEYKLLWYQDRLLLLRRGRGLPLAMVGSFDISVAFPTILVGDDSNSATDYLYVWP